MTAPDGIAPGESLGRGVFSRSQARRAERGRVLLNAFLEAEGEAEISVDRLDMAPPMEAKEIGDRVAAGRGKQFYGWAVVALEAAAANGRRARASRLLDNPYNADIVLPDAAVEDRDEQKRHAQELADASAWRGRDD